MNGYGILRGHLGGNVHLETVKVTGDDVKIDLRKIGCEDGHG
jgi:hypothetical protein